MCRQRFARWVVAALTLVTATLACQVASMAHGPGSFDLPDPAVGLSALAAYRAQLTIQFEGTQDGAPASWTQTYSLSVTRQPAARLLTLETGPGTLALIDGTIGDVSYQRVGSESPCIADRTEPGTIVEPAAMLSALFGAQDVGTETLQGIPTQHFTFDERAIGAEGLAKATGEVWIAKAGGFVVKYVLNVQGDASFFAPGMRGTLTWTYTLSDINQSFTVQPPSICPPGLTDVPLPPNATVVLRLAGYLSFTSSMSPTDIAAFYQKALAATGWQAVQEPVVTGTLAVLEFTQGNRRLSIFSRSNAQTVVFIGPALPTLALSLNQGRFRRGSTLRVGLIAQNYRPALTADFYFGILLPDGVTALFFTSLSPLNAVATRLDADPRSFRPILTNFLIPQGLDVTLTDLFVLTFSGAEPLGTYAFFVALTPAGAFSDGRIDAGDILGIDARSLSFSP